jgi:predicted dehydrogenase
MRLKSNSNQSQESQSMNSQDVCASPADQIETTKTLRAGIIGAGRMGITHLALLGSQPNLKVAAISDDSPIINRALGRYRPDIQLFNDYTRMLKEAELDLVVIATPPHLHAPMIDASLDIKASIFVEKPFTLSVQEARRLTARSLGTQATYQVGYVNRFNDIFMRVKRLLDEQTLGRLISFRSDMFGRTVTRIASGSGWRGNRETGGGCLYEFGSHAIDLMVYFFGRPARVTGSCLTPVYSTEVEDMVRTNVLYDNGLVGSLIVNWSDESFRKPTNRIEILGENGKILADQHELKVYLNRPAPPYAKGWNTVYITDCFTPVPFYVRGNEFTRQIDHFAERAMDPGKPNLCGFSDATVTQEVIDMVFADAGVEK